MDRKQITLFLVAFIVFFMFTGCKENPKEPVKKTNPVKKPAITTMAYGDTYIESYVADIITLNPILSTDGVSDDICAMIFSGLVRMDENYIIVPDLAETWEISADGLSIKFKLRSQIKWQDGHPLSVEDVKYSFDVMLDPEIPFPSRDYYEAFKTLEIIDDMNVAIYLSRPFAPALEYCSFHIIPEHILNTSVDFKKNDFNHNPIGTGPFRFEAWRPDEQIILSAYDDYHLGRPNIDIYVCKVIPDNSMSFIAMQKGELDFYTLSNDQYRKIKNTQRFMDKYNAFWTSNYKNVLTYNTTIEALKSKKVRQALTMAVDRQEIIDTIKHGYAQIITGPFTPGHWAYDKSIEPFPFDPKRSRKILDKEGWKDTDNDGIRDKDQVNLEIELVITGNDAEALLVPRAIQDYWKKIGVSAKIISLDWSKVVDRLTKLDFGAILLGYGLGGWDPDSEYGGWHSTQIPSKENEYAGYNYSGYSNPEVDNLFVEGQKIYSQEERKRIYQQIHSIIHDDQPCLFLYSLKSVHIVDKRFHGVHLSESGRFFPLRKWWVPKELQKYK